MAEEQSITEEIKSNPETFDLGSFITKKIKYPSRTTSVVLDRDLVFKAHELAEEIVDAREAKSESERDSLTGDPELTEKLESLKAELEAVLEEAKASTLTFSMVGVAPKVWRVADKMLRQNFRAKKGATEEEKIELDIALRAAIDVTLVNDCTVKIVDPSGAEAKADKETIAVLRDQLDEREWNKLVELANRLTFEVENLDDAIGTDSDFLSMS